MAVNLEKKHYKYLIAVLAGAIIISIIIAVFIIKPLYNLNSKSAKDIQEKKEVLSILEDKLGTLKGLKSKEEELNAEKKKVLHALPEDKDIPRLFVQLENMISSTGAIVESADESSEGGAVGSSAEIATMQDINNYKYSINFSTSTYESIKSVIVNTEEALRLVGVDNIKISSSDGGFSVGITINTYARAEENNEG